MGTRERRERERENLRRAILDAARDLFVTEGFEAVSMRRIASAIEYSPTAIYLYFADKDAILLELSEEGFYLLAHRLEEANSIADPIARLRAGGRAYFEFAKQHPNYYSIMFELRANPLGKHNPENGTEPENKAAFRAFSFIVQAVMLGIANGQIPDTIVQTISNAALIPGMGDGQMICGRAPEVILSHIYWSSLHGAASLLLSGRLGILPDAAHPYLLDAVVENCLRGLICPMDP